MNDEELLVRFASAALPSIAARFPVDYRYRVAQEALLLAVEMVIEHKKAKEHLHRRQSDDS